ncbi:unnamed protein product [Parnassius apollo]|uniref:(apollo) hypothetical protein n=1 Tax=Parnassius apollo TaxID=110799 RepID=A0A8S3XNF9_PARAO|nr:unnamed protein product [Parnassius apollo]
MLLALNIQCARHNKKQKSQNEDTKGTDDTKPSEHDVSAWPQPGAVSNFPVPSDFLNNFESDKALSHTLQTEQHSTGKHSGDVHKGRRH